MLELQHICYDVEQDGEDKGILRDIDLTIDERFVAITGPNGGGKSTLAKIIAGIYTPTSGRILLDGEDITGLDITQRAHRGVSFAFQQPVRFKGLTVKDLITLASGKNIGVPEACNYLSEVGLCAKDYIDREVDGSLSGGELKRIEIAMIMARGTKLSVFDEPEAGIDLWSFSNLIQVFEHLHEKINGSVLRQTPRPNRPACRAACAGPRRRSWCGSRSAKRQGARGGRAWAQAKIPRTQSGPWAGRWLPVP